MLDPRHGQRRDPDLLAVQRAGCRSPAKQIDVVRDLVLAHGAVVRDAGEADPQTGQDQGAIEVADGAEVRGTDLRRAAIDLALVLVGDQVGRFGVEGVQEAV